MERGLLLLFLSSFQFIIFVQSFFHVYPELKIVNITDDGGDPGTPLFLTKYIESGDIEEGRRLARVPITDELGITSYAGYFTVNKTYDSNQFFWYFPAIAANSTTAPVLVWLQGGPGASSLFGLFTENGPIEVDGDYLRRTEYNWALDHHIIYIDNPVGTGFSFTKDPKGYCTDQTQVGEELYSTVYQFFQLFPELQQHQFFVAGESYGGKYAPALAYTIHKKNPEAEIKMNLKGVAIGNGFSDPEHQLTYSKYLYQIGLIDFNGAKVFEEEENKIIELIKEERYLEANEVCDALLFGDMSGNSIFFNLTGFEMFYNYLHTEESEFDLFNLFLQKNELRKAIHVGDLPLNNGTEVYAHLQSDIMKSVAPWIAELLDHYNFLIYNGQLDIVVAYPLTVNYLRILNFTGADEYETAKREIWEVDGEVAGYVKEAGKLIEVMVRNAGHMVPGDQPKRALDMITRFTYKDTHTMF